MFELLTSFWRPLIEILFIWVLIYSVIRFFQGTRAMQVLLGLVILVVIFLVAKFFELNSIIWVLSKVFAVGVVAFLIIFQPEMRRVLARIGTTMSSGFLSKGGTIDEVIRACEIDVDPQEELNSLFRNGKLTKKEVDGVQSLYMKNSVDDGMYGDSTLWKLTQGISALARDAEPVRKRQMEEISGELFNRINTK